MALLMAPVTTVLGQSYWSGSTGDYNDGASWSLGVPGPFTLAIVQNDSNNVCMIQPGDPAWTHWDLRVADDDGTSGKVVQTGAINNCNSGAWFRLGDGYDSFGYYILSNGVVNVLGGLANVGEYGTGYLEVDNGVFNNGSGNFNFGINQTAAEGTLMVNGGVVNSAGEMDFGIIGAGHLIMHGGSLNVSNALVIGRGDGNTGQGDLYMDGGVINKDSTGFVALGEGGGSCTGIITQTGGTFNSAAPIYLGWNGAGTWNLNGGTAALGEVWMGIGASGSFNLNGGNLTASWIHGNNGVFNFNGGTLRAGATTANWMSGLSAANVQSGGAIIDTAGYSVTIGQPFLAGGGGLTKVGSGTLVLNGANTYTGTTTNAAGILGGAGSLSGPLINQLNATLAPGAGANVPVALTVNANVTLSAGGFAAMNLYKGGAPVSDQVVCSGTVNYGGTLLISSLGTALAQGDTFQLFNAGGHTGNFSAIVGNAGTGNAFSFNPVSGVLSVFAAPINTWNNASTDSLWNGTSANWTLPTTWVDDNDAIFGATGIGAVTVSTSVAAHNLTFNSAGYTIGGNAGTVLTLNGSTPTVTVNAAGANIPLNLPIVGTQGLTINGTSTSALTLGGSNTFSGGTFVRSGTLILNAVGVNVSGANYAVDTIQAIDTEATVKIGTFNDGTTNIPPADGQLIRLNGAGVLHLSGGTFDDNGDNGKLTYPPPTGTGTILNSSPYIQANLTLQGTDGATYEFDGQIKDGGPLVATSQGTGYAQFVNLNKGGYTMILGGSNSFTGYLRFGTSPSQKVILTNNGTLGYPSPIYCQARQIILNQGIIDLNGTSQKAGYVYSGNDGLSSITNSAHGTTSTLTVCYNTTNLVPYISGAFIRGLRCALLDDPTTGGTLALTKEGVGVQALGTQSGDGSTFANNYHGDTTVNNGTLQVLYSGAISPNSAYRLNTTQGTLALNYTGTANVKQLYINGVSMPNGVYGSSTAPITGTGFIQVTGSMINTWNNASTDSLWNGTSANWTLPTTWVDDNDAIFGATGIGAVTVSTSVAAHNLTFNSAGYTIGGNAGTVLTLNGSTPTVTVNAAGANIPLNLPIVGTQGLTINGTSTSALTLGGSNTFSGGTFVRSGTLILNAVGVNVSGANYAVDTIQAIDTEATVKIGTFNDGTTNIPPADGQLIRLNGAGVLHLSGGTFDDNGDNGKLTYPPPTGTGTILNSSPYIQANLTLQGTDGATYEFDGQIKDGGPLVATSQGTGYAQFVNLNKGGYTMILGGSNSFTGYLRFGTSPSQKVILTNNGTLGYPSPIYCQARQIILNQGIIDLNGTSQKAGYVYSGNDGLSSITNSAHGTTSTLTVCYNTTNLVPYISGAFIRGLRCALLDDPTTGGTLALTKEGVGVQALGTQSGDGSTFANNYHGDTTVNNGTLQVLYSGAISSNSAYRLNTTQGNLKLDYAGTANVKQLYINGVEMPNGVYGSSTAPITGTGFIQIAGSTARPILTSTATGGSLTFSWPGGVGNFKLQSQTNSLTGIWHDYPGGGSNPMSVPISSANGSVFFRLAPAP